MLLLEARFSCLQESGFGELSSPKNNYLLAMCARYAEICADLLSHQRSPVPSSPSFTNAFALGSSELQGFQFAASFDLCTPASDRKRALGTPSRHLAHRQATAGRRAVQAGYQMRRGLVPPLLSEEVEPGEAIKLALAMIHPFTAPVDSRSPLAQLPGSVRGSWCYDRPQAQADVQLERACSGVHEEFPGGDQPDP